MHHAFDFAHDLQGLVPRRALKGYGSHRRTVDRTVIGEERILRPASLLLPSGSMTRGLLRPAPRTKAMQLVQSSTSIAVNDASDSP